MSKCFIDSKYQLIGLNNTFQILRFAFVCIKYLLSNCLRQDSNFLAKMRPDTALWVCVCCIICVCDCAMVICEPHMQIMLHTDTHKAVTEHIESISYCLAKGNQTIIV